MVQQELQKHGVGVGGESFLSAKDLDQLMSRRRQAELAKERAQEEEQAKAKAEQIKQLMTPVELTEERITNFMTRVRQTAERGERQILVLRFPSELCSDSGRAINNNLPGWENTLVGLPKQMLEVWREHLKPLGFGLRAQVLDYPHGMPGDIGLFCDW